MTFLIHEYLDAMANRQPNRPAIHFLDQVLDYAELAAQSNRLGHVLVENGVQRHDRVGIYMDKSIDTPIAMYGIMKAGAAYVPLDPSAPVERIASLLSDCGISHVISAPSKACALQKISDEISAIKYVIGASVKESLPFECIPWSALEDACGDQPPDVKSLESDLAYIIYTSGSTGTPKGIMHTHHSGLSFARWAAEEYGLTNIDRLSNHAPLHFDLSIFDYFAAAVAGAATVIVPEEYTKLPASYSKLLADQKVSVLFTVPFALIQMLLRGSLQERNLSSLRWAIFGGEPFPSTHLRALMQELPHVRFDNMYGPAELNGCTHYTVTKVDSDDVSIPIGPIANCAEARIIDSEGGCVSSGEIGELTVRTPTMMRGYWNRQDLNAKVFYCQPNRIGHEEVFFRTGDLVQEQANGILRFVGRKDRQVKVRGYRIELDEIEIALTAMNAVEEAAVYTLPDKAGSQEIHAQVTIRDEATVTPAHIVALLKKKLPWYAIPAKVSITDLFPRTRTGKIDRRYLREQAKMTDSKPPKNSVTVSVSG